MVEPIRKSFHKGLGPHGPNRFPNVLVRQGIVVETHVLAQRTTEQEHVLHHHTHLASELVHVDVTDVDAVQPDGALLEFVKPRDQVHHRTFPCACRPDKRHAVSCRHLKADVAQHPIRGTIFQVLVGKPNAFEFDVALPTWTDGLERRRHGLVFGEKLEDPVRVDNAHLQYVESIRQLTNGTVQHEHVQDELQDDTQGQRAFHHPAHAKPQQQRHACCREHLHHRKEHAECPDGTDVGVAMHAVDGLEPIRLLLLPVEGLHHGHAVDMLLDELVDAGHLVADIDERPFDVTLKNAGGPKQCRNGHQHNQGQPPIDPKHGSDDHEERKEIANRIQKTVAENVGDAINVADVARDKRPDWVSIEKLQPESTDVTKELGTQIQTHALRHPVGQVRHPVLQQRFHQQHADHHQKHAREPFHVACRNVDIHRLSNQRRADPHQRRQRHHQKPCPGKAPAVGFDLLQNGFDRFRVKDVSRLAR